MGNCNLASYEVAIKIRLIQNIQMKKTNLKHKMLNYGGIGSLFLKI